MNLNPLKNREDIVDQARRARDEKRERELSTKAKVIAEVLKKEIWTSEIEVGDYTILMKSVLSLVGSWYNEEINSKKLVDVAKSPFDISEDK